MINLHRMATIITYLAAKNRGDYHYSSMSDGFQIYQGEEPPNRLFGGTGRDGATHGPISMIRLEEVTHA